MEEAGKIMGSIEEELDDEKGLKMPLMKDIQPGVHFATTRRKKIGPFFSGCVSLQDHSCPARSDGRELGGKLVLTVV